MLSRVKGFTLIELMIAAAIIGLLAAIAYPSYQDNVRKSRRADAQGALMELAQFMERTYTLNNTYKPGGADPALPFSQSPREGSIRYYNLSISASTANSFTLQALPIVGSAQDGDGALQLDNTGARRWDKNNDGDFADTYENAWK